MDIEELMDALESIGSDTMEVTDEHREAYENGMDWVAANRADIVNNMLKASTDLGLPRFPLIGASAQLVSTLLDTINGICAAQSDMRVIDTIRLSIACSLLASMSAESEMEDKEGDEMLGDYDELMQSLKDGSGDGKPH